MPVTMATTNKIVCFCKFGMNTVQLSIPMLCYMSYPLNTLRNGYKVKLKVTGKGQGQHSIFTFWWKPDSYIQILFDQF
jgi:hypothetical protein